ncbi:MAG: hypothetical protein BWX85_00709 [Chloroflexi bacterium ADurb.Bin120]|nr:MAG: hypothetical protein BWX85_00709 [Chloroflexi bacterium ADurb.Bin120]
MIKKTTTINYICILILFVLVALSALFFYPYAMEVPHRDSGIYLYLGQELLEGKTIYSEVWEHKPPFIFYVNALGLLLGGGSGWGVWGIEVLFLFTTVLLSFLTLRHKIKPIASLLLIIATYMASYQYMSGNFTEEYALVLQAAILFIFLSQHFKSHELRNYFIIGTLSGIAFNIKQTYIDVTIAIGLLLIIEMIVDKKWANIKSMASIGVGFLIPNLITVLSMAINHAVREWWDAAFIYNFAYSDIGPFERVNALIDIFQVNSKYPLFIFLFLTWVGASLAFLYQAFPLITHFFHTRKGKIFLFTLTGFFFVLLGIGQFMGTQPGLGIIETVVLSFAVLSLILSLLFAFVLKPKNHQVRKPIRLTPWDTLNDQKIFSIHDPLLIGVFHFPIVLFLATASGRNYPHYFIPLYATAFLLFSGVYLITQNVDWKLSKTRIANIIFIALFIIGMVQPGQRLLRGLGGPYTYHPYRELVQYIVDNSNEDDQVLVWGLETLINYLSHRSSPSRFSYVDSLYYRSPLQAESTAIMLNDILAHPPKFILDMRNPQYPFIDGVSNDECLAMVPADGTDLEKIIHFTCKNYQHIDRVNGVEIYKRID